MDRHVTGGPVWYLLHQWDSWRNGYLIRDIFVNLVLYFPVGLTGYLVMRERMARSWRTVLIPVLFGLALSVSMELIQVYVPPRESSMVDVLCNTGGTLLGVLAGRLIRLPGLARRTLRFADRRAVLLVMAWLLWLLFPFVPLHTRSVIDLKIELFFRSGAFLTPAVLWFMAVWYAAGLLMEAAGIKHARVCLALSLLAIPGQILIRDRLPLVSELAGAAAGLALFELRPRMARVRDWEAWGFLVLTAIGGVSPFQFTSQPNGFSLVPFEGLIRADGPTGLRLILGQLLAWGAAIWLLNASGRRSGQSVVLVVGVVTLAQFATIFVPGAAPGVTAPLLAVMAGYVLEAASSLELNQELPANEPQTVA